jgi:heptosyltransferase I
MHRRILIVRLSALGDTALTLPLLFALREKIPNAHIGWVVGEAAAPLLEDLPQLNRIHIWKDHSRNPIEMWRLVKEIHAEGYEISIDPQGLTRSSILPYCAGIPERVGFAPAPLEGRELAPLFNNRRVSPPAELTHVSARNLFLGRSLGLDMPTHIQVQLPHNELADSRMERWWEENALTRRTMVFGIGAGWPTKMWSVEEMAVLIQEAGNNGYRCVILWGPKEKDRIGDWRALLENKVLWAPPTDIQEMIALLRLSNRYAGPDSAALHLAWLLGKPTFSWFGASDPARCAPPGEIDSYVGRGPHTFHRKKFFASGLHTLRGEEVLGAFAEWLRK